MRKDWLGLRHLVLKVREEKKLGGSVDFWRAAQNTNGGGGGGGGSVDFWRAGECTWKIIIIAVNTDRFTGSAKQHSLL